jgi:hypothetical protein
MASVFGEYIEGRLPYRKVLRPIAGETILINLLAEAVPCWLHWPDNSRSRPHLVDKCRWCNVPPTLYGLFAAVEILKRYPVGMSTRQIAFEGAGFALEYKPCVVILPAACVAAVERSGDFIGKNLAVKWLNNDIYESTLLGTQPICLPYRAFDPRPHMMAPWGMKGLPPEIVCWEPTLTRDVISLGRKQA